MSTSLALFSGFSSDFDGPVGEFGEGFVGRGEHGERTGALQGIDKSGSPKGGGECLEGSGGNGGVDDVFFLSSG